MTPQDFLESVTEEIPRRKYSVVITELVIYNCIIVAHLYYIMHTVHYCNQSSMVLQVQV